MIKTIAMRISMFVICMTFPISYAQTVQKIKSHPAQISEAVNRLAFRLYETLIDLPEYSETNLFISPISISTALGMTYLGARTSTEIEMRKALSIDTSADAIGPAYQGQIRELTAKKLKDEYELKVQNKIWVQEGYGFTSKYLADVKKYFGSSVAQRNFKIEDSRKAIVGEVNKWAAVNTNNKIKEILTDSSIDAETRMVLANAVYFLGKWLNPFPLPDAKSKNEMEFAKVDGTKINAQSMGKKISVRYAESKSEQLVELPYRSAAGQPPKLSMVIVLPSQNSSLKDIEKSVTELNRWNKWIQSMQMSEVIVTLPKWEVKGPAITLNEPLKKLGMKSAFDSTKADFSGMTGKKNIHITSVVHKTYVKVDEQGTEAAAVTAIAFGTTAASLSEPKNFRADRPFLYAIRNINSGAILFLGRMLDPSSMD